MSAEEKPASAGRALTPTAKAGGPSRGKIDGNNALEGNADEVRAVILLRPSPGNKSVTRASNVGRVPARGAPWMFPKGQTLRLTFQVCEQPSRGPGLTRVSRDYGPGQATNRFNTRPGAFLKLRVLDAMRKTSLGVARGALRWNAGLRHSREETARKAGVTRPTRACSE
jgi:hypothetical protein